MSHKYQGYKVPSDLIENDADLTNPQPNLTKFI